MEETTKWLVLKIPPHNYLSKSKMGEIHNELFDLVRIKRSTIYPEFRKDNGSGSSVFDPSILCFIELGTTPKMFQSKILAF